MNLKETIAYKIEYIKAKGHDYSFEHLKQKTVSELVDFCKRWALECVGEDIKPHDISTSGTLHMNTIDVCVNEAKQEIRQRILDSIGGE